MNLKPAKLLAFVLSAGLLFTGCWMDMVVIEDDSTAETQAPTEATDLTTEVPTETTTETIPTETTPTETTPTETNPAVPSANYASIAGDWYIDGDLSLAHISIKADGTFVAYYATGNLEAEGYIEYQPEEIEGTVHYWYALYTNDGTYYLGFLDDGSSEKTDLYVGNGAYPHYQKFTGEGGIADDGREPGEEFVGFWQCERARLTIRYVTTGSYNAVIEWSDSARAYVEWQYDLQYQDGKLVCRNRGIKTLYEDIDDVPTTVQTRLYDSGSAEFTMQDGGIVWNDLTENCGEGMVFANISDITSIDVYLGGWGAGIVGLDIEYDDTLGYTATISWRDSAAVHYEWRYPVEFFDGTLYCAGKGKKYRVEYTDYDSDPVYTLVAENLAAEFIIQDDGLHWDDHSEQAGNDLLFVRNLF